jgi:hypothetical protein
VGALSGEAFAYRRRYDCLLIEWRATPPEPACALRLASVRRWLVVSGGDVLGGQSISVDPRN